MQYYTNAYGPPEASAFDVMKAPGELISCALLALPPGVWKFAFRLTVLPFTPFAVLCRGVLGTSPSSLFNFSQSCPANKLIVPKHTCRTCPRPWPLVSVDPA